LTTNSGRRDFGNVQGSQVRGGTDSESSDDSTSVDRTESSSAVSCEHDSSTEDEDERRNEETDFATEELTERVTQEGTEEASSLCSSNDVSVPTDNGKIGRRGMSEEDSR
jgi:hypothetical protein